MLAAIGSSAHAGATLDNVRSKGYLTCGISGDAPGLSQAGVNKRSYDGFEIDLCAAFAAAVLGSPDKVKFRLIDTVQQFLDAPEIDVVVHGLTWTFGREAGREVRFGPIVLYDGQTFLVPKKIGAKSIGQLLGRTVCVQAASIFLSNLQRYYRDHKMVLKAVAFPSRAAAEEGFLSGRCDVYTADATELAGTLIGRASNPDDFDILPELISKEPLAPLLRRDDESFFDVVRWTIFALIDAEDLGIASKNVDSLRTSDDPRIRAFFHPPAAGAMGLDPNWTATLIRSVGNYGEIFDRNLGQASLARLPRGLNASWRDGGLMYAPPLR